MIRPLIRTLRQHNRQLTNELLFEPLNEGRRARLLVNYFSWHLLHKYCRRRWIIRFDNGLKSYVYPYPDHDAGEVNIWTRNVDWHDINLVRSILKQGDFVVDAGCNVGNRTLAIADLIDGALLIDAGDVAAARTRENLELNRLPREQFIVLNKAVGSRCGPVTFTDLGGASTLNRVVEPGDTTVSTVTIDMTTLDAELDRIGRKPSFLKIDVEGQDLEVLRGSIVTLRSGSVRLVKFERNATEPLEPIVDFFGELGWSVFALRKTGEMTQENGVLQKNMNLFAAPGQVFRQIS